MSLSGLQGKWMASSVKERNVKDLREAGYLAADIAHRLPAKKQIVSTRELSVFWERGSPDLPAYGLQRGCNTPKFLTLFD